MGLLLARRTLTKLLIADTYVGKEEGDGEMYTVESEGEKRPFRALLDVGLGRTTTGSKVRLPKTSAEGRTHTHKGYPPLRTALPSNIHANSSQSSRHPISKSPNHYKLLTKSPSRSPTNFATHSP